MDTKPVEVQSEEAHILSTVEAILIIGGFVLGLIAGAIVFDQSSLYGFRCEAVKKGHAHWVGADDGHAVFVWNEVKP